VEPAQPGAGEVLLERHPAGLAWGKGKVPTPKGIVSVEWKQDDDFSVTVDIPVPARVTVPVSKEGPVSVTSEEGGAAKHVLAQVERRPGQDGRVTVLLSTPGVHRIVVNTSPGSSRKPGREEHH